jgi:hypothetical protein
MENLVDTPQATVQRSHSTARDPVDLHKTLRSLIKPNLQELHSVKVVVGTSLHACLLSSPSLHWLHITRNKPTGNPHSHVMPMAEQNLEKYGPS